MRWALIVVLGIAACDEGGGVEGPLDAPTLLRDSAPSSCEEVVDRVEDCPSYESICAGVCNAEYECCYPRLENGTLSWSTLFTLCPSCSP